MAKKEDKTNALRMLDNAGIAYTTHVYDTDDGMIDGVSVAKKVGEDPEQVFKTLVTRGDDGNHYVFVIPVAERLDLKACARSVGVKSVTMIPQKELFPLTGYVHGGCSPVGMKKKYTTVFDETIVLLDRIIVSAGRVGMQMVLDPEDLLRITDGKAAPLTVS
ncbi:MAG: Cys-tRNA(Pro) deacylase [Solobacterium sp.]|nr:Cys-tRNA(Pro) deacylase [Solobacterium sp.]MBQ1447660.1 Cys-tRNA(Pro) deacylase [Solobacterium sp.]MBQ6592964.1 Cys-tRNA(Pro) deacylase [Solobacterium sp.]MBR0478041.1 Cys-tRNA(Pro) deacylase [Solobacterium sp.]